MTTPSIVLRAERPYRGHHGVAEYTISFAITSHVELTTKPDRHGRTFTMLATQMRLHWGWRDGEWHLTWHIFGRRWRKTKGDWSPHEQGYMSEHDIDMPEWLKPLIDANAPTMQPTAGGAR